MTASSRVCDAVSHSLRIALLLDFAVLLSPPTDLGKFAEFLQVESDRGRYGNNTKYVS